MKRTFQPSKTRRIRKFGFRNRNSSKNGRKIILNRIKKGRYNLTPKCLKY